MIPNKLIFIGDTHGDRNAMHKALLYASSLEITEAIQVGDFGFVWPDRDDSPWLSSVCKSLGITLRFIDGNHDYFNDLFKLSLDSVRKSDARTDDNLQPHVIYQHRGSRHVYPDGLSVVFLGGAPSIDYKGRKENIDWWHDELIVDADVVKARRWGGQQVDILVTHDSPYEITGFKETHDMTFNYRARDSRDRLQTVVDALTPRLIVHGHFHHRYSLTKDSMKIEGLGCNFSKLDCFVWVYEH